MAETFLKLKILFRRSGLVFMCIYLYIYKYLLSFYTFKFDIKKTHLFACKLQRCTFQTLPKAGRSCLGAIQDTPHRDYSEAAPHDGDTLTFHGCTHHDLPKTTVPRPGTAAELVGSRTRISYRVVDSGKNQQKRCPSRVVSSSVSLWIASKKYLGVAFKYNMFLVCLLYLI